MVEEVIKLTVVTKNRDDVVLDKEADVEVNREVDKEMAKGVEEVNKELVLSSGQGG